MHHIDTLNMIFKIVVTPTLIYIRNFMALKS